MADTDNLDNDDAAAAADALQDDDALTDVDDAELDDAELDDADDAETEEAPERLDLEVAIDKASACERHICVTVPETEVRRYFDKQFSELMPEAQIPGFRPGHAPRELIERRFRKDVSEKVKSELLMDSLSQISEDEELSAISEPEIDLEAIEIPEEGPFTFEFDLEVRPEFDVPKWKGLPIEKPVREISREDVDRSLENVLANRGRLVPHEGPAEAGDYITTNLTFQHEGEQLSHSEEEVIRIRPVLSFRDGKIEKFGEIMDGVTADETREAVATLTDDAPNVALRGREITAVFEVLEVKRLELPELDDDLLEELGGFELEADLRDAIQDQLERQLEYEQHRRARDQITSALTVAADWELPPELLERQSHRELERAVMELRRSGFGEQEIRAHQNQLRQNSRASTARALKEHFILERIAEEESIDADDSDYQDEIRLIARQSNESARRVRARLEKAGSMDVLRNQIIERKVIELILSEAQFVEVPYEFERSDAEAIDQAAGGQGSDIPEAQPDASPASPGGRPAEEPMRG